MNTDVRCLQCSERFPAHVVDQFGGMCPACVAGFAELPVPSEGATLRPGAVFGRYEILNVLGRGGMGIVYRARQTGLDRVIALKVLSPRLAADKEFVARFEHEARALAKLSHPHIVAVHDSGIEDGLPFLAMEYVEGENLRSLLRERRLPPERALAIVPQLCDALEYAHKNGVIHRDIKPENILLDRSGTVKIADFGLAMMMDAGAPRLTQTNAVMGTPHYMAPEQVENPKAVDHRADIYSMGVVLYEMLTGELPLGAFRKPSEMAAVNRRLDDIVLRALAKEPPRRYQSANDLNRDLSSTSSATSEPRVVKGFEWKTRTTLFGWPLIHVCNGVDERGRFVWAKGVIAIGNRAIGAIAFGGLAIGLMAFGGGAIGLLLAFGGGALGGVALGGGAVGGVAVGGGAFGYYAVGGGAVGRYVVSGERQDPEVPNLLTSCIPMPPDFYRDGMRAWEAKDGEKAKSLLLQVPPSHPNYPEAMAFVAYDLFTLQSHDPTTGLQILVAARQFRPNDPKIDAATVKVTYEVARIRQEEAQKVRSQATKDPNEFFPEPDNSDFHQLKGDSVDFMRLIRSTEDFDRIHAALSKAKSVRVRVRAEPIPDLKPGLDKVRYEGTVLLKEGNRVRADFDFDVNGTKQQVTVVCDGTAVRVERTTGKGIWNGTRIARPYVKTSLEDLIGRVGFLNDRDFPLTGEVPFSTDERAAVKTSGLLSGPDDAGPRTLRYSLYRSDREIVEATLWYDRETLRPLKRLVITGTVPRRWAVMETFTEYDLKADVPDDAFTLK